MHNLFIGLEVVLAFMIIVVILMQPGKMDGFTNFSGGVSDTFFAKNKSKTREAMLRKVTVVLAVLFAAVIVMLNLPQFK